MRAIVTDRLVGIDTDTDADADTDRSVRPKTTARHVRGGSGSVRGRTSLRDDGSDSGEEERPRTPNSPPVIRRDNRGSRRGMLREVILNIAAIGGVVCIALTLAAVLFNVTLIMFKTGSMSPTIPAGSLAVVREIPAEEARVGDVVTVARPGKLPVTHRVVATEPATAGSTLLTLRGDANPVDDPEPYLVTKVRIVMASVPGLASVVVAVSNPLAMGIITVAVASLVTWVFWPRKAAAERPLSSGGRHLAEPIAAPSVGTQASTVALVAAESPAGNDGTTGGRSTAASC